jgi:hypothetical protein
LRSFLTIRNLDRPLLTTVWSSTRRTFMVIGTP